MIRTVAMILIDDVAPFELGVICEVFGIVRAEDGIPSFELRTCGSQVNKPMRTSMGFDVTPCYDLTAIEGADVVALPAYTIREEYPADVIEAVRAAAEQGSTLLSVCSGAFLLGAAGLLDGRTCTTHWRYADALAARFPAAKVDPDVLFVDDGNLITSAGTAAGIDACLHLVRREMGASVANSIARRMVVPAQRDGGQRQFIELPVPECSGDNLQPVLVWLLDHLTEEHSIADLARRANMSERTFARRFSAETGTTPHRWLTMQRVLHARELLEQTRLGMEEIARASGFGTATLLRHHFRRIVGVSPNDYRRTFAGSPAQAASTH